MVKRNQQQNNEALSVALFAYMETPINKSYTNRLINASSPYLLQHAHNPVDWYEWGEEAFERARSEQKLVLISIGYSACHWCHVMERECFEQEDTAAIMNRYFVCIKVDREERPDVDQLYMDAVQMITGQGGWPLNCFTLPDGRPIHGGTYFPKTEWERVLKSLADFYEQRPDEAMAYATDLTNGIRKLSVIDIPKQQQLVEKEAIAGAISKLLDNVDTELGGFNWAPKFPMPTCWELLLQQYHHTKQEKLWQAVDTTLVKMAEGGIYDQIGGGFARYSTDSFWKVPHFEKMLYDNAQLVSLYTHAWQLTQNPLYAKVVSQTLDFVKRELTHEEGYFFSALDADSEGIEGKYYLWTQKELQQILGEDEPLFSLYYNVDAYGNWEHGANILYKTRTDAELTALTGKPISEIEEVVNRCSKKLLAVREQRIKPGLDDKMVTAWNALMVKAYAEAAFVWQNEAYLSAAKNAASFIMTKMWSKENGLMRITRNGKTSIHAFADDYALTIQAMIKLFEVSEDEQYILYANELMEEVIRNFYNEEARVFLFKSKTDAPLVAAKIDLNDDVIPSANSVMLSNLMLLGYIFSKDDYHDKAMNMMLSIQHKALKYPNGYSNWLSVIAAWTNGIKQVIVTGKQINDWKKELASYYLPNTVLIFLTQPSSIPLCRDKVINEARKVYLCIDKTCGLPKTTLEDIEYMC